MTDDTTGAFSGLFTGAARLGLALGGLELPWQQVAPLVAAFPTELGEELELAVADHGPPLWVRTRGDGKATTFRMARFMEERGVAEPALRRLLTTAQQTGHRHLLFEVAVDGQGVAAFRWLVRQPLGMETTRAWLAAEGAGTDPLARISLVADALDKSHVQALGEQVDRDGAVQQHVAFSFVADGGIWPRLELAASRAEVPAAAWALLERHVATLAGRDGRVVVELSEGSLGPGFRLDLAGLGVEDLARVMAAAGSEPTAIDRVRMMIALAERERCEHATFRVDDGRRLQTTVWTSTSAPPN